MTDIYPGEESKTLEFKSKLPSFNNLIKTCIAFANGMGGKIIFGVDDVSKRLIDVTEKTRITLYDQFLDCLYDSTQPAILGRIYEQNLNDHTVVVLEVTPTSRKPCFLKKSGVPDGVFLRVGSHTRKATPESIEDLVRESQRISYDEEIIQKPRTVLSDGLLEKFYGKQPTDKLLLAEQIIGAFSANSEKLYPTVAGILFFCEEPQRYLPEACLLCTEFRGTSGREIISSREIKGPIPTILNETLQLIKAWLAKGYSLQGAHLKGELPVPEIAIREALTNALLHRKYSIPGAVKVGIWEDRIEIFSPGCFPGLVDVEHLGNGITYLRNPILARLAHKIGLVERLGTGIKLIFEACQEQGLRSPVYNEDGDFVKVTFYFSPSMNQLLGDDEKIIEFAKRKETIHVKDIMQLLEVSHNTASRKITALIKSRRLIKMGAGPNTRYKFKKNL